MEDTLNLKDVRVFDYIEDENGKKVAILNKKEQPLLKESRNSLSRPLQMKCRYLNELTDGHGVVFATGTPISNSMVEMYTTQNILRQIDKICEEYNRVIGNMELEPLIAIPIFIHDFLCIHPFNDGNGRMSRLLTTLLLYRNGFYVGKYVSLETVIT